MTVADLTPAAIAHLRSLLGEATKAPWVACTFDPMERPHVYAADHVASHHNAHPPVDLPYSEADAALIVALRNAAPELLAAAEERDRLREALETAPRYYGAPGGVHNHGPEDGPGFGCSEFLIGACRLATAPGTAGQQG